MATRPNEQSEGRFSFSCHGGPAGALVLGRLASVLFSAG